MTEERKQAYAETLKRVIAGLEREKAKAQETIERMGELIKSYDADIREHQAELKELGE